MIIILSERDQGDGVMRRVMFPLLGFFVLIALGLLTSYAKAGDYYYGSRSYYQSRCCCYGCDSPYIRSYYGYERSYYHRSYYYRRPYYHAYSRGYATNCYAIRDGRGGWIWSRPHCP